MSENRREVFKRELHKIFSDSRVALLLLLGPFFYLLLFGGVYYYGQVRRVPLAVIDRDNSRLSRELTQALRSSENLRLAFYARDPQAFKQAVEKGEAVAAVVFPEHFERELKRGRQGRVLVLLDAGNILIANVAYRAVQGVLGTYQVKLKAARYLARGVPRSLVKSRAMPLQSEFRILFNPTYHYGFFLLMGLVCISLQQVTMMGAAIALSLDGKLSGSPGDEFLGRFCAHSLVMLPLGMFAISLPFVLFLAPFRGSWPLLFFATALFMMIAVSTGFWIAGICRKPALSAQALLYLSVPVFVLSGFSWPMMAMPGWVQGLSNLLPLTHYAGMARRISLMGAGLSDCWSALLALIIWLALSLFLGYRGIKKFTPAG